MTIVTILAPNARWQGRLQNGQPAIGGKLFTWGSGTTVPKTTWQDPGGVSPNSNPIILDAKGEANIYWEIDSSNPSTLYHIQLTDPLGNIIYDQDKYPTLGNTTLPPPPPQGNLENNIVRNPQFTYWTNSANYSPYGQSGFPSNDWHFTRNNTQATINITRKTFSLGQTQVPGNPVYFMEYVCTGVGSGGETFKYFYQTYKSVQTFSGQVISFAFWAMAASNTTITVELHQFFGTGGSPSPTVVTTVGTFNLTTTWAQYPISNVVLPSVAGKNPGSNGDDELRLVINMPLNAVATIDFTNIQLQNLNAPTANFPFVSQDDQFKKLNTSISNALFYTGDFKTTLRAVADPGWILCDDGTLGNDSSGATHAFMDTKGVYELIWANIANSYAPIFNSDGTAGTRGANSEADYNANKRLALTKTVGRILASSGAAVLSSTFTASSITSYLTPTVLAGLAFFAGTPVTLTSTGTLPSPLTAGPFYYVIPIDNVNIQLATTLANAVAGIPITLTTNGSGTMTIQISYAGFAPGEFYGEFGHALTVAELASHDHSITYTETGTYGTYTVIAPGGIDELAPGGPPSSRFSSPLPIATGFTGGSTPHNITQPTTFVYTMIKL